MSGEPPDSFPPRVDAARIVADQRGMTPEQRAGLYRRVFGSQDGQAVLLDLLVQACVSTVRPADMSADHRTYYDGQQSVVLTAMNLAGYGVGDIAGVILSNSMRGLNSHERSNSRADADARTVTLPGDDAEPF